MNQEGGWGGNWIKPCLLAWSIRSLSSITMYQTHARMGDKNMSNNQQQPCLMSRKEVCSFFWRGKTKYCTLPISGIIKVFSPDHFVTISHGTCRWKLHTHVISYWVQENWVGKKGGAGYHYHRRPFFKQTQWRRIRMGLELLQIQLHATHTHKKRENHMDNARVFFLSCYTLFSTLLVAHWCVRTRKVDIKGW